jgi:hypothetical protein
MSVEPRHLLETKYQFFTKDGATPPPPIHTPTRVFLGGA